MTFFSFIYEFIKLAPSENFLYNAEIHQTIYLISLGRQTKNIKHHLKMNDKENHINFPTGSAETVFSVNSTLKLPFDYGLEIVYIYKTTQG